MKKKVKKQINLDELTSNYEIVQGAHATNCGLHFRNGAEKVLDLTKERLFSREEMIECFNSARKTYGFKKGRFLDVHHSAESYVDEIMKKK